MKTQTVRLSHVKKLVRKPVVVAWELADQISLSDAEANSLEKQGFKLVDVGEGYETQTRMYDYYTPKKYKWRFFDETC
jgi:hypothetical protein